MENKCVYQHVKPDGEIFYIGIGNSNRPFIKHCRRAFWNAVVKKYPDYVTEVILKDLTSQEAKEVEIYLISYYGRRDLGTGTLVNLTDGGDGVKNTSQETKDKIREKVQIWNVSKEDLYDMYIIQNLTREEIAIKTGFKHSLVKDYLKNFHIIKDRKQAYISIKNKSLPPIKSKKVIDTVTGEIFDSVVQASIKNNIKLSTLTHQLLGTYTNKTNLRYHGNAIY